ncbi:MAG: hypothetical protein QM687_08895 [Ferruginibacter sp.]
MKWIIPLLLSAISTISSAQSVSNSSTSQAVNTTQARALTIADSRVAGNRYYQQLNSDPGNAGAWLQFYIWLNRNKEEKQLQDQTLRSSRQYIAQSWQYSLMRFIASGKKDGKAISEALDNTDDKRLVYPYAIHYAIISEKPALLRQYATAFNALSPLSAAQYEYHYNVLMSAGPDALLYGKGLTDLAPMAVLQQVYGVRKDVQLKYYDGPVTANSNAYICLSAGKEIIESYPGAGYSGLLIQLAGQTDAPALEKCLGNFSLAKLETLQQLAQEDIPFYSNYIPSFVLLYKFLKKNNNPAAVQWKARLEKLAALTGTTSAIEKVLAE